MSHLKKSGLVIYARDLNKLTNFYSNVMALQEVERDSDYVLLIGAGIDLVILQPPEHIRAEMQVATPPQKREKVAIKPVFYVADIAQSRALALQMGGQVFARDQEWQFHGYTVCDGNDTEGNVFQLRQENTI